MSSTQRNFLSLSTGEIGSRVLGFAATALLARRVGADGFGILGLAFAVTSYLIVPGLGLQDLAAREVAKHPLDAARLTAGVIRVRLLLSLALVIGASLIAMLLPKPLEVRSVLALSTLMLLPLAANASWAFKALERTAPIAISMMLSQLVYLLGIVSLVTSPEHVLRVPIIQAVGEIAAAVMLLPVARGGWSASSVRSGIETLRGGTLATASRYLRALTMTADVVLLSFLMTDRDVGLYSAAYRVCFLVSAIAVSAHAVFIAPLTRARDDATRGSQVLSNALWLSWTAVVPLVIGGAMVAPDLMSLLFGAEFRDGAVALQLLLVSMGLMAAHGAVRNVLLVRGRMDLDAWINGGVAVLNIGLNVVVIPRYGLGGAAAVMVLSEAVVLIASLAVISSWQWRPSIMPLLRPSIAVVAMAAVLFGMPSAWPVMVRVAGAGGVYVAALALLGEIRRAGRAWSL